MSENLSREEVYGVIDALSSADMAKINSMASLCAGGLVKGNRDDLIQEAFESLLAETRSFPRGVSAVAVILNVIRSIASNTRKREISGAIDHFSEVGDDSVMLEEDGGHLSSCDITPERIVMNRQLLHQIVALVADDPDLEEVVTVWAMGFIGNEAAELLGWDFKKYEAVRKRLKRRLDGLNGKGGV